MAAEDNLCIANFATSQVTSNFGSTAANQLIKQ